MYRRFSELTGIVTGRPDFVIREYRPKLIMLVAGLVLSFIAAAFAAFVMLEDIGLAVIVSATFIGIIVLGLLSAYVIHNTRKMVTLTEFQNALFAAAAAARAAFFIIVSNSDRSILYFSPSYRKIFSHLTHALPYTVDEFLDLSRISKPETDKIIAAIGSKGELETIMPVTGADGTAINYGLKISPIKRPDGFSLIYATNEENSATSQTDSSGVIDILIDLLPQPAMCVGAGGKIISINSRMRTVLGVEAQANISDSLIEIPDNNYEGILKFSLPQGNQIELDTLTRDLSPSGYSGITLVFAREKQQAQAAVASQASLSPAFSGDIGSAFKLIANDTPIAAVLLNREGSIAAYNQAFCVMKPISQAGIPLRSLLAEESLKDFDELWSRITAQSPSSLSLEGGIKFGGDAPRTAQLYLTAPSGAEGGGYILAQFVDTTEQKNLEMRFAHSQKMQAVGQLAGGIAHDFNNLLTAMIGFCDLLLIRHPAGDQSFADIMQIKQNATRAANLVRQLLAFSRRQTLQPKTLDVTDTLADLSNLLRRLIGENIELKMVHGRDVGFIKADQGQFEQVLVNLAVNARDAIGSGGVLTIRTGNVKIEDRNSIPRAFISPTEEDPIQNGEYVLVEIQDTGHGIPHEIMPKIFEPFFSTKEVGSGTGLGLATVYGIIKQTGGYIYVASSPQGTQFNLYFKRHFESKEAVKAEGDESQDKSASADLSGTGTILLVEDEAPVRIFSARALRNKGYNVLEADCAEAGLEEFEKSQHLIEIVVTDVIMPGMNGPAMIEKIMKIKPGIKVIFMSGYAEDVFKKNFGSERDFNFLPKPFTLKQLAGKVKEVAQKTAG